MTDREKLVELLESHCAVIGEEKCKAAKEEICSPRDCAGCLADHLIANGVTVQPATDNNVGCKWRDAKTDPPKEWKGSDGYTINYLVYCPEYGVDVGNYIGSAKRWVIMGLPAPVTHWKPLPEAPKED